MSNFNSGYDLTIYNLLKKHLSFCKLAGGSAETLIRCPFCGDSNDPTHGHFYIANIAPYKCYCHKCNVGGIFSKELLNQLDIKDNSIDDFLKSNLSEYISRLSFKYGNNYLDYLNTKEKILLPHQFDNHEWKRIDYINNRLGININTEEEIEKYSIILNLKDFLKDNEVNIVDNKKRKMIEQIHNDYVCFLLNDSNMITARNMKPNLRKDEMRYINFRVYDDSYLMTRKMYTIRNRLNLASTVFNINMTEGIFDILGVYHHIHNKKMDENDIFLSCSGKSFNFVLNYLKSLSILNCNINVYSDADVNINWWKVIKNKNQLSLFNGLNIYYNRVGKDFGVRKDQIQISDVINL